VGGNEIGTTPLQTKLASGTYSVLVKMKNRPEAEQTAFINPDETTDMYFDLTGGKIRGTEGGKNEAVTSGDAQLEYAETSADRENKQKTKENVDTLIKELESMVKEQSDEGELKTAKKAKKSRKETVEAAQGIPISLKEFTVKMGTLSHRRDMERLRQRIIDSLLSQKGLSVVERELEFQEEILREQRLSGSILADKLFRVALGKIQGAAFLCFGGVSSGDASDQLVLRMEIVDTATTLIETLEYPFKADDNLRIVADNVAAKIREKIAAKRKL
jgi:hypothetical protein